MKQTFVIAGAALTSTAYAAALTTQRGRQFRREYTWLSVIVGVSATLAWLALSDTRAAYRALQMFSITGLPIIVMCVGEDLEKHAEVSRFIRGK